jgi:putative solute:sodium symporter small subunit
MLERSGRCAAGRGKIPPRFGEAGMDRSSYWRANLRLIGGCLVVWFVVSFGCGVLWVDWLNRFEVAGVKVGFWFAQQGSIYAFLLLIVFYVRRMNRFDRDHDVHED